MNKLNPMQAIERLKQGNGRFLNDIRSVEPLLARQKMPDLAAQGQRPFAIVLTCSDSRSPVEMIFDQGLGDLFVVRVAGNVVAPSLLASIEFAAANFGSSVVVVLGHTQCGAVKATIDHARHPAVALPSPHLEELVGRIRPAIETSGKEQDWGRPDFVKTATEANVRRSMRLIIDQSQIVHGLMKEGRLSVEGAILDISTGAVNFFSE